MVIIIARRLNILINTLKKDQKLEVPENVKLLSYLQFVDDLMILWEAIIREAKSF